MHTAVSWPVFQSVFDDIIKDFETPFGFYGDCVRDAILGQKVDRITAACWGVGITDVQRKLVNMKISRMSIDNQNVIEFIHNDLSWKVNVLPYKKKFKFGQDFVFKLPIHFQQIYYDSILGFSPKFFTDFYDRKITCVDTTDTYDTEVKNLVNKFPILTAVWPNHV